ncbi:MAG: hypothetical protein ACOYMA_16990 [Bacteroidia bacterium]
MLDTFISNSKGLTKNPLGIIALFVSLIYGFACLVLSTSISNLKGDNERLPLIWFIIGFPIVILLAFIFLVVKHHEKLYSPSDYRADEAFIQTIGREKIQEKQLKEVKELEKAKTIENTYSIERENSINTNTEQTIDESSIEKENIVESEEQLLSIYKNTELWTTKELSLKYNVLFKNNVTFSIKSGNIEQDAWGYNDKGIFIVEIKYWKSNKSDKKLKLAIQEFLSQHRQLEATYGRNGEFKLIVAFVFDILKNVNKSDLLEFTKNIYNEANVEFFDYEELRENYE